MNIPSGLSGSSRKAWLLTTTLVILFPSLLKKEERRKGKLIAKIVIKRHAFLLDRLSASSQTLTKIDFIPFSVSLFPSLYLCFFASPILLFIFFLWNIFSPFSLFSCPCLFSQTLSISLFLSLSFYLTLSISLFLSLCFFIFLCFSLCFSPINRNVE